MKLPFLISLFIGAYFCSQPTADFKNLNVINLLLPKIHSQLTYSQLEPPLQRITYKLVASHESCYEWGSTNPDSLSVTGWETEISTECQTDRRYINEDKCFSEATVAVNSLQPVSKVIWITAKEKKTGEINRVESKISSIHKIQIVTRLRSIDVGDNQVIMIQGVDEYGNIFTSLEGIQFEWEIRQNDTILQQISFADASIQTTQLRIAMEKMNIFSDTIVVKGIKTGTVQIYARIKEEGYELIEDIITMKVIEHFFLFPEQEVYILPTTSVQFDLALVKTEKNSIQLEKIELPNQNYLWEVKNTSKGEIKNNGLFTATTEVGKTQLQVSDIRISDNFLTNIIHIVEPKQISLQIKEYEGDEWDESLKMPKNYVTQKEVQFTNNWNLVKDRLYYVRAFLFDHKRNPILITENIKIKFNHENTIIEIIEQRNYELVIKPKKQITKSALKAYLHKIMNADNYQPKQAIETEQLFAVYSQIKIIRPGDFIHLPFISNTKTQVFQVRTIGGSGGYQYKISNYTVAQVEGDGLILAKTIGTTLLNIYDLKNPNNKDEIIIEVTAVQYLTFPDFYKEMLTNSKTELFIIAQGNAQQLYKTNKTTTSSLKYSNCSNIQFSLTEKEELIKGTYNDLPNKIQTHIKNNRKELKYFKESIDKWKTNFNFTEYKEYIESKEMSQEILEEILNEYQNYGVCGEIELTSELNIGQINSKVRATNIDHPLPVNSEQITVKIYTPFQTIQPLIDNKEFLEGIEIILSYGSSFIWQLDGGPQYWEDKREMKIEKESIPEQKSGVQIQLVIQEQETARYRQLEKQFLIACPNPSTTLKSLTRYF